MKLVEKFEATRDYLQLVHGEAIHFALQAPRKAEELAEDVWGEDFVTRIWEENPQTAWADFFITPALDVLLIVGEQDLDTDGKFYVAIFDQPIQVEKFGDDRLYIYFDTELPLQEAPEEILFAVLEFSGKDAEDWNFLEFEDAAANPTYGWPRAIFETA